MNACEWANVSLSDQGRQKTKLYIDTAHSRFKTSGKMNPEHRERLMFQAVVSLCTKIPSADGL